MDNFDVSIDGNLTRLLMSRALRSRQPQALFQNYWIADRKSTAIQIGGIQQYQQGAGSVVSVPQGPQGGPKVEAYCNLKSPEKTCQLKNAIVCKRVGEDSADASGVR